MFQYAIRSVAVLALFPLALLGCSEPAPQGDQASSAQEAFARTVRGTPPAEESTPADPSAAARIELQTAKFDMGLIENDRTSEQRMKVFNRGNAPLKISHVSTSCGCTTGEMASNVIAPGESADLIIRVDPAKIPGFFAEKVLTVFNNDPSNPQPTVNVVSHVKPEATFTPDILDFGQIALGESKEVTTTIRQQQEPALAIAGAALGRDLPFIEVKYDAVPEEKWTTPGKREYTLTARVTPDALVGVYDEWIWVNTNIKRYANIPVKFKGEIVGPYAVSPRNVALRAVIPGTPMEGVLSITSEKSLKILEVSNTNSAVTVNHRPGGIPNSFVFDVTVPQRTPSRALRDTWTIKLDADGKEFTDTVLVTLILSRE